MAVVRAPVEMAPVVRGPVEIAPDDMAPVKWLLKYELHW